MTAKNLAKQVIESLPDNASMDEIIHALYVNAKFEHGEAEIRSGRGVPHDEAKKRLQKWVG